MSDRGNGYANQILEMILSFWFVFAEHRHVSLILCTFFFLSRDSAKMLSTDVADSCRSVWSHRRTYGGSDIARRALFSKFAFEQRTGRTDGRAAELFLFMAVSAYSFSSLIFPTFWSLVLSDI
ncbi:hypothetical protein EUGRSUZ_E00093 [Eucalyptus grandis]|uniref:Uncharacterized protein n=2 Tax=Eucalyptus grandis TaxID=71139 RepID=A0ACC3KQJ9_EUCGR|nr:hypothetical protein EUGRSUZ_E00093 [Eucalyptus grandis]